MHRPIFPCLILVPVLACVLAAAGGSQGAPGETPDQDARQILQRSGDYLRQAKRFRVEATETFEEVLEGGQKVQVSNRRKAALRRPNRLYAEASGDTANR